MEITDEDLVDGYLTHLDNQRPLESHRYREAIKTAVENDSHFWAWEALTDAVERLPERAWLLLLKIIDLAPEDVLHVIGAGPLEELIVNHPDVIADWVEAQLRSNDKFRTAFRSVYLFDVPERCWSRFNQVLREVGVPESELRNWSKA
jgi:hypothetical protein